MGYITYGRTRSKRGQVEIVPEEERIKVMGTHEKLKTQDEHEQIISRLSKNRTINPNARRFTLPLSNILYCGKCGYKMQLKVGYSKQRGQYWSALCVHSFKDGSRCEQKGKILDDDFFNALFSRIINVDPNILQEIELHGDRNDDTKAIIQVKEQELMKHKRALEKLHESFEEDIITKQIFVERKAVRNNQIQKLEDELRDLRNAIADESGLHTVDEIYERIDKFREKWSVAATPEEKNKGLKKLVERIVYNREDNRIELTVCYR